MAAYRYGLVLPDEALVLAAPVGYKDLTALIRLIAVVLAIAHAIVVCTDRSIPTDPQGGLGSADDCTCVCMQLLTGFQISA